MWGDQVCPSDSALLRVPAHMLARVRVHTRAHARFSPAPPARTQNGPGPGGPAAPGAPCASLCYFASSQPRSDAGLFCGSGMARGAESTLGTGPSTWRWWLHRGGERRGACSSWSHVSWRQGGPVFPCHVTMPGGWEPGWGPEDPASGAVRRPQ